MTQRILVIDDDPATTRGLRRFLEKRGYEVREENDSMQALDAAREYQPAVVILDYLMPRAHGGDVAWQLASDPQLKDVRVIICSALPEAEVAAKLPPVRIPILGKPVDSNELLDLIREKAGTGADRER